MATRILAAWYLAGQDHNYPPPNFDAFYPNSDFNQHVQAETNDTVEYVWRRFDLHSSGPHKLILMMTVM
jgi:hypothetical protein